MREPDNTHWREEPVGKKPYQHLPAYALCVAATLLFHFATVETLAEEPVHPSVELQFYEKLDRVNRRILLKDVELEQFNIRFRRANSVQGRWRGPRYFLSQEGNAVATAAGVLYAVEEREESIRHPFVLQEDSKHHLVEVHSRPHRVGLENAIYPQLVGQCLGMLGSSVEYGINMYHDHQAHARGFAPKAAIAHVQSIKKEMESLFAERTMLLETNSIPPSHMELAKEQGLVLEDLCNLALNEYQRFHITTRRFRSFQDSLYLFDIAKNATGAVGNILALYSTSHRRPRANGPAGIFTTISASLVIAGPICSRLIGKEVGTWTKHRLEGIGEKTESTDLAKLQADETKLNQLMKSAKQTDPEPDRFFAKTVEVESLDELTTQAHRARLDLASRELRAGTRASQQNILAGTIYGGSKLGPGLGTTIAGFRFPKNPTQANILICDGNLAYFCGTSVNVLDNIRIQVQSELNRRKLLKENLTPAQILSDHLKKLDDIERQLVMSNTGLK